MGEDLDDGPEVAHSDAYRRRSLLEAAGARLAGVLPDGALRRALRSAYRAAIGLAGGGRVEARLPGGETVRLLPEFRFVTWNPAEYHALRAAATPGAVALDVGANVGGYALLLGRWVSPGGRVYAFEPAPDAFDGLTRHVRLNGLAGVVVPVREAAAGSTGTGRLAADGVSGANRLGGEGGAAVATVTLDDFCAREGIRPTVIKIDVEGAELEVLRGGRSTLRRCRPVVAFEHGLGSADHYGTQPDQVYDLLADDLGMEIRDLEGGGPYGRTGFSAAFWNQDRVNFVARPR
jgi:FkbM family methyltransferase